MSDKGHAYGDGYKTVLRYGSVKFVRGNFADGTAPFETETKGRVYVSVNSKDQLKTIAYYDAEGRRRKSIDLGHPHKKMQPHAHHGYVHNENDGKKGASNLTTEEKKMVERVKKLWHNYLNS